MSYVTLETDSSPKFTFLASPPLKKKRAAVNNTFRAPPPPINPSHPILAWASNVHPGSPAPMTPISRLSLPRPSSLVSSPLLQAFRRSSPNTSTNAVPVSGTPFLLDAKVDLTVFGYASSFLNLPVSTPTTPEIDRLKPTARIPNRPDIFDVFPQNTLPSKSSTPRIFKHLLGTKPKAISRTRTERATDHVGPSLPDSVSVLSQNHRTSARNSPRSVKVQKPELSATILPLTLKEGNVRQGMEGDIIRLNIHKATGGKAERERTVAGINVIDGMKVTGGVSTTHRDALGGIWWNQKEEWELGHPSTPAMVPLSAQYPDAEGWVTYNHLKEFEREESFSLPLSKHADLYHSCPVLVTDEAAEQLIRGRAMRCTSIAGSIVLPSPSVETPDILLAIPSRPKRGRHLKPGFLKDIIAVPPTPTPPSPHSQASRPSCSPARAARFIINTSAKSGSVKRQRSRSRSLSRRKRKPAPPPLKIVPICPVNKLAVNADPEGEDKRRFQEVTSRWSRDTTTLGLSPALSGYPGNRVDDSGFMDVDAPKKSRRLGRFFKDGEKDFWTR